MAKKQDQSPEDEKLAEKQAYEAAIEEKVHQMLDIEAKDAEPETAPELASEQEPASPPGLEDTEQPVDEPPAAGASAPDNAADESAELPGIDDDPATDKAVDDIVAKEGDELLAVEDEKLKKAAEPPKPDWVARLKAGWHAWWHNPTTRRLSLAVIFISLLAAFTVPSSRYFILNSAGVRSSASLVILDNSTQQPLKNVTVTLGNQSGQTDSTGQVQLRHLRLGRNRLIIHKRAFAKLEKTVTLGWGSNPLGDIAITPTGSQYNFLFTDYLSGKPLSKVEANSGDASALSNDKGELKLTIDKESADKQELEVIITADEYRQETVVLNLDSTDPTNLQLVPARQHIFISKRSGKYDVYKVDADGQNEQQVLAGTGFERDDMVLAVHPTEKLAALVSTRDNARNSDGFLLSTLTIIDLESNMPIRVAQSERIQIVDWVDKRLVYVRIARGASASDPNRHRLMSYDFNTDESKELASSNYFNDVFSINSVIYYAPSSAYTTEKASLLKIKADGSGKQTTFPLEVWNVYRTDYDKLILAVNQEWYEYKISDGKASKLNGEPANLYSRVYINNGDNQALWVDSRDGKGVLLAHNIEANTDKVVHEQSGLTNPIRWLSSDAVVYRIATNTETADYVMSLSGGEPKKLRDVTNTSGVDRWYYY